MASSKKKLPTGPIRIDAPVSKKPEIAPSDDASTVESSLEKEQTVKMPETRKQDYSNLEETKLETSNLEDSIAEASNLETRKQDYSNLEETKLETSNLEDSIAEASNLETRKQDSGSLEASNLETGSEESRKPESTNPVNLSPQTRIQESGLPESGSSEPEYKKVAMRLSVEAVENLRQLRTSTGIPYEILVDVMIRNWDNLPQRTRNSYLQQARQVRMRRLMAGQQKTMKTMQQKYLEQ